MSLEHREFDRGDSTAFSIGGSGVGRGGNFNNGFIELNEIEQLVPGLKSIADGESFAWFHRHQGRKPMVFEFLPDQLAIIAFLLDSRGEIRFGRVYVMPRWWRQPSEH